MNNLTKDNIDLLTKLLINTLKESECIVLTDGNKQYGLGHVDKEITITSLNVSKSLIGETLLLVDGKRFVRKPHL